MGTSRTFLFLLTILTVLAGGGIARPLAATAAQDTGAVEIAFFVLTCAEGASIAEVGPNPTELTPLCEGDPTGVATT